MTSILVVEDELYIRENLVELLESEGYKVFAAKDGEEGFKLAETHIPDLVLSDIRMPKLDGLQLLKKLQENTSTSTIPLIFLTAKVELNEIREGMTSGADDYIPKPFKSKDVLNAIQIRLSKKKKYEDIVEQLQSTFIKNVPHELRTPLISILGFSELIESDIENLSLAELKDMVHRINYSGKRLHRRIEKLIKLGFLLSEDALKNAKNCTTAIDGDSFYLIIYKICEQYDRKDDISTKFEEAEIFAKEEYLEGILQELIENAVKFSKPGSPIKITGKVSNDAYSISVEDRGKGIEIKDIKEADIFKKIDTENDNKEGLGLGLAIVKRLMEISDGSVSIKSVRNKSTNISISFKTVKK